MRAVATVIMNRVNSATGEYSRISQGGSIRNILYQPGQFDCATDQLNNRYNPQNIYNQNPTDVHYNIADWAIAGNKLSGAGTSLWYMNPFIPTCQQTFPRNGSGTLHTRIVQHCFYRPTDLYTNT
ncbi:Cell Wall Hydrolase [compost metagenome]